MMKKLSVAACVLMLLAVLTACGGTQKTIFEMELTENYNDDYTFINEKLFCVSEDVDELALNISFEMEGKFGILEVLDNKTEEGLWIHTWGGDVVERVNVTAPLSDVKKDKEYVVRFTGTEIKYAKIVVSSGNGLVQERERPLK